MPGNKEHFWAGLSHIAFSVSLELLGIYICYREYISPDRLEDLYSSLLISFILDCVKIVISFLALIILLFVQYLGSSYHQFVRWSIYILGGLVAAASIYTVYSLCTNFESTTLASMPWFLVQYYLGITVYALVKLALFGCGLLYTCWYALGEDEKPAAKRRYRYVPIYYKS
eukprot:TRINITY_DN865_c0_g1_i14.p1 TRINITY_DN865_c0_g1~~TRINITY_DN865_c0_g1_i14.p1  ORF type:complete len:171 (+),score=10.96 TRINITY_DN865_c0_g1_i14:190-702(+)